ncbi:MAG: peptidoglycan DD-metalloendopeptidase family protein [Alphaproteobacteria bacterium]
MLRAVIRPEFRSIVLAGLLLALYPTQTRAAGELESVERALDAERRSEQAILAAAGAIEKDLYEIKSQLVAAAQTSQAHEDRITAMEAQLVDLSRREAELSEAAYGRSIARGAALGALVRLSRQPPQALIATPAAIDDVIRASLALKTTASMLGEDARRLGAALSALKALHRRIASQRMELEGVTAALAQEDERLEALHAAAVVRRQQSEENKSLAEQRVARLSSEADNLRDLFGSLAAEAPTTPADDLQPQSQSLAKINPKPFSTARGSLPMPARGRLVALFGEGEGEQKNKGITIETRDDARVITPYDGEVVYAGPFRGYGRLLIIDHGEGYHTLLAGFSRIDSFLGQWLLAGEPVGVMGRGLTGYTSLYVEFRHDGIAVNPLNWLMASGQKADG